MIHILLCGGSGTRLWPMSNVKTSKQFLRLFNGNSLLQMTISNCAEVTNRLIAVTADSQSELLIEQLSEIGCENYSILKEPVGRNTCGAIALAAFMVDSDDVLFVTPSDHLITTPEIFKDDVAKAMSFANLGYIVTIGLQPTYPETGFGYMEYRNNDVLKFIEKPSYYDAELMVEAKNYLWNSGMFCFRAGEILNEIRKYEPEVYNKAFIAFEEWKHNGSISRNTMEKIPSISIDYAVMERSEKIKVVPSNMKWSDVGSFESLVTALGNFNWDQEQVLFIDCDDKSNAVIGINKFTTMVGVENLIVVNSPDALLILKKGYGQKVKDVHKWVSQNRNDLL